MENNTPGKAFWPIAAIFIVVTLLVLATRNWLATQWNMDFIVGAGGQCGAVPGDGLFFLFVFQSFTK